MPKQLLLVASNPAASAAMKLSAEARAIEVELARICKRHDLTFDTRWTANPLELMRELRKLRPSVLHLCGTSHALGPDELADTISAAGAVKLVVLGGCGSDAHSLALRAQVPCVIGIPASAGEATIRTFSAALYRGLGTGEPVQTAFVEAVTAVQAASLAGADLPSIQSRPCRDASRLPL